FRELAAFSQFASDLDAATQKQLARGERIVEILKQPQYQPLPVENQVMMIFAVTNGYLDDVKISDVRKWETDFLTFMIAHRSQLGAAIRTKRVLDDELTAQVRKAIEDFKAMA